MPENFPAHAIAIIGLAGRFPGARSLDEFWHNISAGIETIESVSDADLDAAGISGEVRSNPYFVRKCTVLDDADRFDADFFRISPREAEIVDPQQRIFLECAWEALESAGYSAQELQQSVGVYAGASMNTYLVSQLMRNPDLVAKVGGYQIMLGNDKDYLCTRVSYKLNLRGPSLTIQTACSTSLVAVAVACQALNRGECDMALAGGVSLTFPQRTGYLYEEGMILSPDGHCRPFDIDARGTRGGAGAGIVVLKRLDEALADRDTIHAVIRGAAINNDGAAKAGYTAPSIAGQVEAIGTAQSLAGVDPRTISYIEAHGTGTQLGDPIEIAALTKVFRASTPDIGFCRIGSLKANIGHLDAAAGIAGLIKTVLALKHREIPPLVNFRKPNPQLGLESSPFTASAQGATWSSDGAPRRAGVSSFGIGGTNAHVVLEETPPVAPRAPNRNAYLFVLSAKTSDALNRMTADLADFLEANESQSLSDVEWTLQAGRQAFSHRCAVVADSQAQAVERLRRPDHLLATSEYKGNPRPVGFLFSGQGSQYAGMGRGLYDAQRVFREAIDRCAELLKPALGLDIRDLMFTKGSDTKLNETRFAQPALFATEYALASLWRSWGVTAKAMLGHSIGEYVAAHLAGVMSLDDALAVVAARGRLMQELPTGSMAAVHLPEQDVRTRLGKDEDIDIAAVNGPALCTVSGPTASVAALMERLKAEGVEAVGLRTSHAFHSRMMEPALSPFIAVLRKVTLSAPSIPYVSNVTGNWITAEQATSPDYYASQLRRPVLFKAGIETLAADAGLLLLEVGPGGALGTMAKMCVGKEQARHVVSSLPHANEKRSDSEAVLDAAGRLWLGGVEFDWLGFHADSAPYRVPLPTYPFERKSHWVEAAPSMKGTAPSRSSDVEDWLYAPTWTRDDAPSRKDGALSGCWLVLGQPDDLTAAVASRLLRAGAAPIVIEAGDGLQLDGSGKVRVRADAREDIAAAIQHVHAAHGSIAGAIYLWSATEAGAATAALSYFSLVALAESLQISPDTPRLPVIVATFGAESVLDESVHDSGAAMAYGPVLALPTEVPGLAMRAVDFARADQLDQVAATAEALISEAADGDAEKFVAWRAGRRWVRRYERFTLPAAEQRDLPIKERGVYLITGGLGGIGVTLARWLASQFAARLVLTSRMSLPGRDEWDRWLDEHESDNRTSQAIRNIRDIEQLGGEVIAATADAADLEQMGAAIEAARGRWGAINGVIHAAGISGNGRLAFLKQPDDVQSVLSPKIDGLAVLVRLLGDTRLDFVALMSSINAVISAPGVCDYAAANAVLDAFVDDSKRPAAWQRVVAFDWAAWRDVGMAARLVVPEAQRAMWKQHVQAGIPSEAGVDLFARILASGRRRAVISPYSLVHTAHFSNAVGQPAAAKPKDLQASPVLTESLTSPMPREKYEKPATNAEQRLVEIWSELLGIKEIGIHDDFFDLGGHSLLATRMMTRVYDKLGVRISLRDVFDAPTIHHLAARIDAASPDAASATAEADREEMIF